MKKFATFLSILALVLAAHAQNYYKVEVKTYVGSRLDDTFSFVMEPGKTERKGFEGKLLSKNYNANGFEHYLVAEIEKLKGQLDAETAAEEEAKKNAKRPQAEVMLEQLEKKVSELKNAYTALDRRSQSSQQRLDFINEKIEMLEKIIEAGRKTPAKLKEHVAKYEKEYEAKKDDVRPYAGKRNDYAEFDFGSYADFTLSSVDKNKATFSMTYAYSTLLNWTSAEGNNNGNSITKFPLFESYFANDVDNVTVPVGVEYCVQFGRRKPQEAQNLQEALRNTSLFGHKDIAPAPQAAENGNGVEKPTATAAELAEIQKIFEASKAPEDTHGLFSEIREKYSNPSQTVRAVIKVTPFKL